MAVVIYKEKIINDIVERMEEFIKNINQRFPELKVKLNRSQIYIICNVFYDKLLKKHSIEILYNSIETLFIHSLFGAVNDGIYFDFECLRSNKLILQKYLKPNEIENILETIDKKLRENKKNGFQKVKILSN